jgi:hypothetical protein
MRATTERSTTYTAAAWTNIAAGDVPASATHKKARPDGPGWTKLKASLQALSKSLV